MIALNNTSIVVGQIKQLLKEFNLPLCRIGDKNLPPNSYYIKDNMIYYKTDTGIFRCFEYNYNVRYLNITDNFVIDNMIYDKNTHEYLGKYLRFIRDYKNINLMSMYNCFDGNPVDKNIVFKLNPSDELDVEFKIKSNAYIVYKIPISIVDTYSISLHNSKNVEVCLYDAKDAEFKLAIRSYKKTRINNILYYKLCDISDLEISNELYMLIKVPKDLNTFIVVLEGKYYDKSDKLNILPTGKVSELDFKIAAQLLSTENTYGNYLLADRIIEYLTGAAIWELSEPYDIKRMQKSIDTLRLEENFISNPIIRKKYGIWDDGYKELIKYLSLKYNLIKYDSLGYVDKDVEKYLIANTNFDIIQFDFSKEPKEER